jgi:hypothetical protein
MTATLLEAPELAVHSWFNTDRPIDLKSLRGRVVALVAFQALCPNSVAFAIPQARRIHETFEPKDVCVIGLHSTFEHHEAYSLPLLKFPVAVDCANAASPIPQTMDRYNMRGTPSLVLIDRQGYIRKHAFGASEDLRIGAEIGALTQERATGATRAQQISAA